VALARPAPYVMGAQLEVGLLLEEQTKVQVTVETPDGTLLTPERWSDDELPKGPHTLRFPVPYGKTITAVHVSTTNSVVSCVTEGPGLGGGAMTATLEPGHAARRTPLPEAAQDATPARRTCRTTGRRSARGTTCPSSRPTAASPR
jgi:hypothetical protein